MQMLRYEIAMTIYHLDIIEKKYYYLEIEY